MLVDRSLRNLSVCGVLCARLLGSASTDASAHVGLTLLVATMLQMLLLLLPLMLLTPFVPLLLLPLTLVLLRIILLLLGDKLDESYY